MVFRCPALKRLTRDGRVTGVLVDERSDLAPCTAGERKNNLRPNTERISRSVPRLVELALQEFLRIRKEPWLER